MQVGFESVVIRYGAKVFHMPFNAVSAAALLCAILQLLELIEPLNRGLSATQEDKEQVEAGAQ